MNPSDTPKLKVLLIAPYFDKNTPGESWSTYQWVARISQATSATVLTTHKSGWDPAKSPIGADTLVNWDEMRLPKKLARLDHELKPGYVLFYLRCRKWIKARLAEGARFDLVHQINPLAMRYPCPAAGLGLKVILGPYAGSLPNPPGFDVAATDKSWFRRLRSLDTFRFRHDPWMRRSLSEARLVLGVAPYVRELLADVPLKDFAIEGETGVENVNDALPRQSDPGSPLRLLYVGRVIRTKGLIDAIRALGKIAHKVSFTLDVLGDGDMRAECEAEAKARGLDGQVHFWGRVSREQVSEFYRKADLFVFPSFREPSGNVVFEALGNGLPVLTTTLGGPGYVVDETCGIRVNAENPERFVDNIAAALERVNQERHLLAAWSAGAAKRMNQLAHWERKTDRVLAHYFKIAGSVVNTL
jgi:glycosyltransferase involved in cell wall biosynthesis